MEEPDVKGDWVPSRAVEQAIKQAEAAFTAADYDRAEHLAEVVLHMTRRDAPKISSRSGGVDRQAARGVAMSDGLASLDRCAPTQQASLSNI